MAANDREDELLRSVAFQNAQSIVQARRRVEEDLRRQSEWLRVTLASIGDAVISTDAESRITFMNGVAEALTGWPAPQATGLPLAEVFRIVHEVSRAEVENPAVRALREGATVELDSHTVLIARDGTERSISDSASPIRDEQGVLVGCVLVFRDITEHQRASHALRASEGRYRFMAEALPQIIWTARADGTTDYCNGRFTELTGVSCEELCSQGWDQFRHPDDVVRARALWEASVATGEPFECEFRLARGDGAWRWHLARAVAWKHASEHAVKWFGTCTDIHENQLQQRALEESEARLRVAQQAANLGLHELDPGTGALWWDPRTRELWGLSPDEPTSLRVFWEGIHPEDVPRIERDVARATDPHTGGRFDSEYRVRPRDGSPERWIRATGTVSFHNKDGARVADRMIGTTQDITARKRLENERERTLLAEHAARTAAEAAVKTKDEFLATLSHELRTPLSVILLWTHLIGTSTDERVAEGIRVIERNARHQSRLISDLLDMSRIAAGKLRLELTDVDLDLLVVEAVESFRPAAAEKNVTVHADVSSLSTSMLGDAGRLSQIVQNLLSNSLKFTPDGGSVRISLRRQGGSAILEVSDTGIGMSPGLIPHLFQRFHQGDATTSRRYQGLGIGLALVRELTAMHGGTVSAASPGPSQGATFTVELPIIVAESPRLAHDDLPEPSTSTLRGVRILLIEDEPDERYSIVQLLRIHHAEVTAVGDADEALASVRAHAYDVILCDLGLPGVDGFGLIRAIRGAGVDAPIVALTAHATDQDRDAVLAAGFTMHIPKPFEPMHLVRGVRQIADKRAKP